MALVSFSAYSQQPWQEYDIGVEGTALALFGLGFVVHRYSSNF